MKKKKRYRTRAEYMRDWRAKQRAKTNWDACHVCGKKGRLIILDGRPKDEIPYSELRHIKTACFDCLMKDQPLLSD